MLDLVLLWGVCSEVARILSVQSKGYSLSDGVDVDLRCPFHVYI